MTKRGCGPKGCPNKLTFDRQRIPNPLVQSTLYRETFQSGTATIAPNYRFPTGWTLPGSPYAPTNEWTVYFDSGVLFPVSNVSGASGAKALLFANNDLAENIVTAIPFSTVGFTNLTIDLLQYRKTGSPTLTIEWSTDNATWTDAGLVNATDDDAWHQVATMSLPSGAENKANIYIRFRTTANDGGGSDIFFAVDDLTIKGYS